MVAVGGVARVAAEAASGAGAELHSALYEALGVISSPVPRVWRPPCQELLELVHTCP